MSEINIKSSTIEKGLDLVKDFIGKLLGPTIEEIGILMADKIKYFRFKNQVKILVKAQEYVKSKNISIDRISLKILVPLLENASLEQDEKMQDKWAHMIGNLADTEQNLQNQIFPYLLSQISLNEYERLLELQEKERVYIIKHINLLDMRKENNWYYNLEYTNLSKEINKIEQDGFWVDLEDYEYSNLQRLGLIRQLPPKILIDEFKTSYNPQDGEEWHQIQAEYDPDDYGYRITSLGIKFLSACEEKN